MGIGKSLQDFIARSNGLMGEAELHWEIISPQNRMVMVATRLREPWKQQQENNEMDRERDLTLYNFGSTFGHETKRETKDQTIHAYVSNI
jgi:hypothetical protein